MNFPQGSKNEALLSKFDNTKALSSDQLQQYKDAVIINSQLIQTQKTNNIFDIYESKAKPMNKGGDLRENFIETLKSIDYSKNVLSKHRIKTNNIPNISQYGNEQVQNQVRVEEVKINLNNIKPTQTPNVKKSGGCCSIL